MKHTHRFNSKGHRGGALVWVLVILIAVGACGGVAFVFLDGQSRLDAWQVHSEAKEHLDYGRHGDAVQTARRATVLVPDSGAYRLTYNDAQRRYFQQLDDRLRIIRSPMERLEWLDTDVRPLRDDLDEEYRRRLDSLMADAGAAFMAELKQLFDSSEAALDQALEMMAERDVGSRLPDSFAAEYSKAVVNGQRIVAAGQYWQEGDVAACTEMLASVAEPWRGEIWQQKNTQVEHLRDSVAGAVGMARSLAESDRYMEARKVLLDLQPHASWMPVIEPSLASVNQSGSQYAVTQLVGAVLAGDLEKCGQSLDMLAVFRGDELPFSPEDLLEEKSCAEFIRTLRETGIAPADDTERVHHLDIVLCAAVLDSYTDPAVAHRFLADGYLSWAQRKFEYGQYGKAAYLARLANVHDAQAANSEDAGDESGVKKSATELFEQCLERIRTDLRIQVIAAEPENRTSERIGRLHKDVHEALLTDIRERLAPPYELISAQRPSDVDAFVIPVYVSLSVDRFDSNTTSQSQMLSHRYKAGTEWVPNPAHGRAQSAVYAAQQEVRSAQTVLNQARSTASRTRSTNALAGMLGMATVTAAEGGVQDAERTLMRAQQNLANTPQQISSDRYETFNYPRITHSVNVIGEGTLTVKGPFESSRTVSVPLGLTYQTIEIKGDPAKGVQSQLPTFRPLSQIETELAEQWLSRKRSRINVLPELVAEVARDTLREALSGSDLSPGERDDAKLAYLLMAEGFCAKQDRVLTDGAWVGVFGSALAESQPKVSTQQMW